MPVFWLKILIEENSSLRTLDLSLQHPGEGGSTLELSPINCSLSNNSTLMELDLSFNKLSQSDINGLAKALSENSTQKYLNLCKSGLDDTSIQLLGDRLPTMKALQTLNILANRFHDTGADALLGGLQKNFVLCNIEMPRGFLASDSIEFLLSLNIGGRGLLLDEDSVYIPRAWWGCIFEHINRHFSNDQQRRASVIFFFVLRLALHQKLS